MDKVKHWVQSNSSTLLSGVFSAGRLIAELATGLVLTLFLTLFFLIDGEREWGWVVRLLPTRVRPVVNGAGRRAFSVLSGWIGGTALIALIHAVVIGVTLWLLGTPLVLVLVVLLVENLLEGHVYQPLIMGRTVRLHPVDILIALTIGAVLAGIMGAIASIPLAAAVFAAVKYVTGVEDIHGNPVTANRPELPEPPTVVH